MAALVVADGGSAVAPEGQVVAGGGGGAGVGAGVGAGEGEGGAGLGDGDGAGEGLGAGGVGWVGSASVAVASAPAPPPPHATSIEPLLSERTAARTSRRRAWSTDTSHPSSSPERQSGTKQGVSSDILREFQLHRAQPALQGVETAP